MKTNEDESVNIRMVKVTELYLYQQKITRQGVPGCKKSLSREK
jgi:hypothetical protein